MTLKEKIVNIETGEESWRDYTSDEMAQVEEARAEAERVIAEKAKAAAAKADLLEKLGITEEEAKLLLS